MAVIMSDGGPLWPGKALQRRKVVVFAYGSFANRVFAIVFTFCCPFDCLFGCSVTSR